MRGTWPLVGRDRERGQLAGLIADEGGAVLAGGAGVGKTRLGREVLADLARSGCRTVWTTGTRAGADIPFGALSALLPPRVPPSSPARGLSSVGRDLQAIRQAVRDRRGVGPMVLAVDDAHCLDPASAALVHQLAVDGSAVVLAVLRTAEPAPDAVTALWKDAVLPRVDLGPLPAGLICDLLDGALGAPVERRSAERLAHLCQGNCLLLRELLRTAVDSGGLVLSEGRWRLTGSLTVDARLVELIEARTGELTPACRTLLEHLALAEPLPLAVFERLAEPGSADVMAVSALVDLDDDHGRVVVRFAHPLYCEVVRSRVTPLQARARYRRLAEALAPTGLRRRNDVLRWVSWRWAAGVGADGDRLLAAAARAIEAGDDERAVQFASAVLDGRARPAGDVPVSADGCPDLEAPARVLLADALARLSRFGDARVVLDGLAEPVPDRLAGEVAVLRAALPFLGEGREDDALAGLEKVEAGLDMTDPDRGKLRVVRARLVSALGRPLDALALVADLDGGPGRPLEPWVIGLEATALAFTGRFAEAEQRARRALSGSVRPTGEREWGPGWVHSTLIMVGMGRGEFGAVEHLGRAALARARAAGNDRDARAAAAATGWAVLQRGDLVAAAELFDEGCDAGPGVDLDGLRPVALGGLAAAHALAGDVEGAEAVLARADAEQRPPIRWFEPVVTIGRAHALVAGGSDREAGLLLRDAIDEALRSGSHLMALFLVIGAVRVGAAAIAVPALDRLAPLVEGPLVGVWGAYACAVVARDGTRLDEAGERLAGSGMILAAAECAAAAAGAHRRAGRWRRADAARVRSRQLYEQCPGAVAAPADRPGPSPSLTGRERQVGRLAAGGLANAAIAARLGISVRTVETHLSNSYLKLGIAGRLQLHGHPALGSPPGTDHAWTIQ